MSEKSENRNQSPTTEVNTKTEAENGPGGENITPEKVLDFIKPLMKEPDREIADALKTMADLYKKKAQFQIGESLYRQALTIIEKELGPEHPELARTIFNFAEYLLPTNHTNHLAYIRETEPVKALYLRAIQILEKAPKEEEELLATVFYRLGCMHIGGDPNYYKARDALRRSLEIRERVLGKENPDVARTLSQLGISSHELYDGCDEDEEEEALSSLEKALTIFEKCLGNDHFEVAQTHIYLGNIMQDISYFPEAKDHAERAMDILNKIGPDHPELDDRRSLLDYFDDVYGEKAARAYNAYPKRPGDPLISPDEAISDEAFDRFVREEWESLAYWFGKVFSRYFDYTYDDLGGIYVVLRADPNKGGEIYCQLAFGEYLVEKKRPRLAGLVKKWGHYSKGIVVQYLRDNGKVRTVLLRGKKESETPSSIYLAGIGKDSPSGRFRGLDVTAMKRYEYLCQFKERIALIRSLCDKNDDEFGEENDDELSEENDDE